MSAIAVMAIFAGILLIYSGVTGQALFLGTDARVPKLLRGQ